MLAQILHHLLVADAIQPRQERLAGGHLERPAHQWLRLMQSALGEKAPTDDPVQTGLVDAIESLDLEPVLSALESMPLRESTYVDSRPGTCRFVVHHDLSWNPSTIEQRTGRVDRIGSKAEKARRPIHVYLPFVTATQDEKMFRLVRDRERWFSVVMGEKYQLDEGTTEKLAARIPFPEQAARELAFDLSVPQTGDECGRVGTAASG